MRAITDSTGAAASPELSREGGVQDAAQARLRRALIVLEVFLAVGAIGGGLWLAAYPAFGGDLPFDKRLLEGSPFSSYLIPGLYLLVVIGFGGVLAAVLHLRRFALAPFVSAGLGLALCVFEAIEIAVISFHFLQAIYFVLGLTLIALAVRCERRDARRGVSALR